MLNESKKREREREREREKEKSYTLEARNKSKTIETKKLETLGANFEINENAKKKLHKMNYGKK